MSILFDKTLHYLGRAGFQPSIVVIGAMDGHSFDHLTGYSQMYRWSGLYIEPIREQYLNMLDYHNSLPYIHSNKYENCAIAEHDGEIEMLTIDTAAIKQNLIHPCFGGMSAVYPPRNGLASEGDAETVLKYGRLVKVPCKTLKTVLTKHQIYSIDILQIDAEGYDWKILKQLDFSFYRPKLIRSEYINLEDGEKDEIIRFFKERGYVTNFDTDVEIADVDFVDKYFWDSIK